VEWKKGPRPAVAAPTSPVKIQSLFFAGLDISIPVAALQKSLGLVGTRGAEHVIQVTVSIRGAALNTVVLNSAKVSSLHTIRPFRPSWRILASCFWQQ
jgi:hypothetical protein